MLTRDISLIPAIIDLVDNSTDGARRLRGDGSFQGLEINIDLSSRELSIQDNCGGIPVDIARDYAFRFGRPEDAVATSGEIGRFGVGMKRALFKMGRYFHIESVSEDGSFALNIDVNEWAKDPNWEFAFAYPPLESVRMPTQDRGTRITISRLHDAVADSLASSPFVEDLRNEIATKLQLAIEKGIVIRVNTIPVRGHTLELVTGKGLDPAHERFQYPSGGPARVLVELYCGLGKSERPADARRLAGWYVFCNGRMLLEADKTRLTIWGEGEEGSMPGFHPQYNLFRGYAYFQAEDAADLPWNTTKTGIDLDSPVYRAARQRMIGLARPVITFLNRRKSEIEDRKARGIEDPGPLEQMVDAAKTESVASVAHRRQFVMPQTKPPRWLSRKAASLQRIQYDKPIAQVQRVMEVLKVRTFTKVGERTFDYFYSAECRDE